MRYPMIVAFVALAGCGGASRPGGTEGSEDAANTATDKEWVGQAVSQPEELFAGRFAGVQVFRVPGGISVRIRGATSFMAGTEPLYVIDEMPIEPGPGGALMGINPNDIAQIEVLKDIGSTSFYGSRGANGVILIKTKRGK